MKQRKRSRYCIFSPYLYIGTGVKNTRLVKWRLTHGAGQLRVWLIAEAPLAPSHLAVLHAANLKQAYYARNPLKVYGIAAGRHEADEMLIRISDEAAAAGHAGELKRYLDLRAREGKP